MSLAEELRSARELLPWHVTGRLGERERLTVGSVLARSPQLAAEREWLVGLRSHMSTEAFGFDEEGALDRLRARVRAERSGKLATLPARRRWARPALALAATLLLAQAALIGFLLHEREAPAPLAPLAGPAAPARGELLQVVFHSDATEAQMRAALGAVGAEIVSGPGALGIYTVRVGAGMGDGALAKLRAQPAVESVTRSEP